MSQGTQKYMHVLCAALCVRLHIACNQPAEIERSVPRWAHVCFMTTEDDLSAQGNCIDLEGDTIGI